MPVRVCRIPFESVADYAENRATPADAQRIAAHLAADCARCRATLAWLANATPQIRASQQVQVPQTALSRAYSLFRERMPAPVRPIWQALLQFDSRSSLAFAGARGQAEGASQLRFSVEGFAITLFQEPTTGGAWYLIGQVIPTDSDDVIVPQAVTLVGQDGATQTFTPQAEEFHLPAIDAGTYDIHIRLDKAEIVAPAVQVGTQAAP